MNALRRRLLRTFVEAGGDIADETQVDGFRRRVEAHLAVLPPKLRAAVEIAWRNREDVPYAFIAERLSLGEGVSVSPLAVRQRISRGTRLLARLLSERHSPRA